MTIIEDLEVKEGWRRFVASEELVAPARWTRAKYDAASTEARARYDEERRRHHSGFGPVLHERAVDILNEMLRQVRVNRYSTQLPLVSVVLDGDSFLGKSTLLRTFGWLYEHKLGREGAPSGPLNDYCPVVNISLEADMKVVDLNETILRFLGAPLGPRGRNRDLKRPVIDAVRAAGVQVVLVDELNFLKKRFVKHQVVNDHLKWLMNHLPATLVFAGVDCTSTTLVSAAQTSSRLKWFRVEPFPHTDDLGKREWQRLLAQIERHLLLLDAPAHMLSEYAALRAYLHRRSSGSIGTLLSLLRSAADEAMLSGHERIDIVLLDRLATERGAQEAQLQREGAAVRGQARTRTARTRRPTVDGVIA